MSTLNIAQFSTENKSQNTDTQIGKTFVHGFALDGLQRYISKRQQTVSLFGAFSQFLKTDSGVLRGSMLGQLAF